MRLTERARVACDAPEIGPLWQSVQALFDADRVLPQDGQWLLAMLEEARQSLTTGDLAEARAGLAGFIDRVRMLIQDGVLAAADGHPPIDTAQAILASLDGEGPPAA